MNNYMLLGRLIEDCEYYLHFGRQNAKHLWAEDEKEQINAMKDIWFAFDVKPEWASLEQINDYETLMCA